MEEKACGPGTCNTVFGLMCRNVGDEDTTMM